MPERSGSEEDDSILAELEARYSTRSVPKVPTADEARALAKEDAVEAMGLARERRGDAGAYPAVCIADPYGRNSAFRERLGRARADQWPDDVFEAYLHAFVLDLAAGNVALVQRPRSGYEAPEYFVVDLEIWKSIVDGYRLGEMLVSSDPYKEWRPRSRWRRLQL